MNLSDLLADLSGRGVKLWAADGELRVRAPKGVLTPELQEELSSHKAELLALLIRKRAAEEDESVPLRPAARDADANASFMQERLWFLDRMYPQRAIYNLPNGRRMRGPLDVERLRAALLAIVERHEILRTTFEDRGDHLVQIVAPVATLDLETIDLTHHPDRENEATRIALAETERPFDLATGPLLRLKLLVLGRNDHLFYWCFHHIVSDGWSSKIFLRELKLLYEEKTAGGPSSLPALPVQFRDFAIWERNRLDGEALKSQLAYWRGKLGDIPPVLMLPADHPRPPMLSYQGGCHSISFTKPLSDSLKSLAQRTETTPFMVLLTAFKLLLHRYTTLTDICVGTPVARRNRPEIEGAIGCFINTLALRTDLSGDPRLVDLLGRVRETCTEAFGRQDVPFEKLVEELSPERDMSHTPIFQVMLILHVQDARKVAALGDVEITALEYHAPTSKLDLTLELKDTEDGLEGWFEYSTDLFEESTIARMASQLSVLFSSMVETPELPISELQILPEEERQRLLVEWNATAADYPRDFCVHELISEQAERLPEATAVVVGEGSLGYRELEERSNRLARYLRTLGVGVETPVGLYVERSLEMAVGLLGVLKSGGAYVPLDPSFPRDRLAFMVRDARVPVILTQSALAASMPESDARVVALDGEWETIAREDGGAVASPARPDTLAYVIYTSGSTGLPKGVAIEHRALTNFLWSMRREPGLTSDDRLLAVTTLSFDIAGLELYLPWITGATVIVASREEASDGRRLAELLDESRATAMQATPATWRMLIDSGWKGAPDLKVLCGGESLGRELANELLERSGSVWNLYGPTETTIWSTAHRLSVGEGPVLVGRPIANTRLYVLDGNRRPVPTGAPGELHIGGDGLARGYLGREQLTSERFVPDPYSPRERARMYRTGDLVRYRGEGLLEVLGRLDHQVKVRGFRMELGEIETVLSTHEGVRQAVVVVREDQPGDRRLVSYFVPSESSRPSASELRAHLKRKLPEYMIPSAYVELAEFPLTPNGKVDRRALPGPEPIRTELLESSVAPRTAAEETIARIWAEVLGVEKIGVHDDFFDLGGHSLLGLRVLSKLEKATGHRVELIELFQGRTVEHLARFVSGEDKGSSDPIVALRRGGTRPPFFAGGSNPRYLDVARNLASQHPFYKLDVYAMQSLRLTRGQKPHPSIEDIAGEFLEGIRLVQPSGPYFLGGGCEGAFVAFEVATEFQRQGEPVGGLIVWITSAPQWGNGSRFRRVVNQAAGILRRGDLLKMSPREMGSLLRHEYLEYQIFRTMDKYVPRRAYEGRLTLLRTMDGETASSDDPTLGWGALSTAGVDVHPVPGTHKTWLVEHTSEFSEILDSQLRLAGTRRMEGSSRPAGAASRSIGSPRTAAHAGGTG